MRRLRGAEEKASALPERKLDKDSAFQFWVATYPLDKSWRPRMIEIR